MFGYVIFFLGEGFRFSSVGDDDLCLVGCE